jgi:hypothetical protein
METLLYLAPLSGFPFAHEALTWMGSTVTVGSEGTRALIANQASGRPDGRTACARAASPAGLVLRPTDDLSLLLRALACWLAGLRRRSSPRAFERHVGGWGHVARAVRAGGRGRGRRRRRRPVLVLSATRGRWGHGDSY